MQVLGVGLVVLDPAVGDGPMTPADWLVEINGDHCELLTYTQVLATLQRVYDSEDEGEGEAGQSG